MARPALPLGTWGNINYSKTAAGYRARCLYRDYDGRSRDVEASGKSKAHAKRRLLERLQARTTPGSGTISGDTKLAQACTIWLAAVDESDRAPRTKKRYREVAESYIIPVIGEIRIREVRTPVVDRFLTAVRTKYGAATAKLCRTVLSGVMKLSVQYGASDANPVRDVNTIREDREPVKALSLAEAQQLRTWLTYDDNAIRRGIADLVDIILATSLRIGEVLALRWDDVDLSTDQPSIHHHATVIRTTAGLVIQEHPKNRNSGHVIPLVEEARQVLVRRQREQSSGPLVFPTRNGTPRDPDNVRDYWRAAMARAGFDGVTPHTLRKTVATHLEATLGVNIARAVLGHSSTAITERHYVAKAKTAPDVRAQLGQLFAT